MLSNLLLFTYAVFRLQTFYNSFFVSLTLTAARIRSNGLLLPVMLHVLMNFVVINKHYIFG
ncbi:hypothetical protein [Erwinia aphidicola]|uniref:hypothetical protein n=1 Tax=Erwinia aphidicola TaxID=68334 RepID=UPI003BB0AD49